MKTIIKSLTAVFVVLTLSAQVNAQGLPTPGSPPSLNPTVPSNPQGLPPNSNFPPNNTTPPVLPGSTGNITPPEVPNNTIKTVPGYPGTPNQNTPNTPGVPGVSGPTGYPAPSGNPGPTGNGPRGSAEHSCNNTCNHVDTSIVLNPVTEANLNRP